MMNGPALQEVVGAPRLVKAVRGRGVRVYAGRNTPPEPAALERLLWVSGLPWVAAPVVALPDLHWKDRLETPSSTAVATASHIVPSFSSPSQNCGMNLLSTPFGEEDLTDRFLDDLMTSLREIIPKRRKEPALGRDEVVRYCRSGAPAAAERFGLDPGDCARIEYGGNVLAEMRPDDEAIVRVMDRACLDAGRYSFAFIGGGNHFLELQVVTDLIDAEACRLMGLSSGQVVAMFHTGSERLGHDLGRLYTWRRKTTSRNRRRLFWRKVRLHLLRDAGGLSGMMRRWSNHFQREEYVAIPAGSPDGERLELSLGIAANYGYANRAAVTGLIQRAMRRAAGRSDLKIGIVADLSHNTIGRERIGDQTLWVHRHNAARAIGPSALPADHPYRSIGHPVMVPGTNRTSSFVIVARDGSSASLHSVDHGAGRTVERFERAGLLRRVEGRATRKYTYASPAPEILEHLSDEAIEEVVSVAGKGGLARAAARTRPVAVLKA